MLEIVGNGVGKIGIGVRVAILVGKAEAVGDGVLDGVGDRIKVGTGVGVL